MKKTFLIVSLLLALLFAMATPTSMHANVLAQDPNACYDATGAVIPCPSESGGGNEDDEDEDDSTSGGNQKPPSSVNTPIPTASFTPVPTATPLPFALPESDYLGSCNSANGDLQNCLDQFTCEDGTLVFEVDIYTGGNGTQYDVYCIPHETIPTLDLPLANPTGADENGTEYKYAGVCHFGDGYAGCISDFLAQCDADGGLYDEIDTGQGATVATCELPEKQVPTEESPAIAAAPTATPPNDGSTAGSSWDEECGYWTCWMSSLSCMADGGSGYELDHASGAHIYHCDVPDPTSNAKPASPWLPWLTIGGVVILVALLLPAVQKVREAAARTSAQSRSAKIDLINKDDGGTEASDYLLEIDGIKGESKQHIKKATLTVRKAGNDHQE